MDSIEKRLDYLTRQVKDLQDEGCNCCEGGGEELEQLTLLITEVAEASAKCCESNSVAINNIEKTVAELTEIINQCCEGNSQAIEGLKKDIAELNQQFQFLSQSVGLIREGNKTQPMPVNPTVGEEYSYGGDVFFKRYELNLINSIQQQWTLNLPSGIEKVLKMESSVSREGAGTTLFLDSLSSFSSELSVGENHSFVLRALLGQANIINLTSSSASVGTPTTYNGELVKID